MNEKKYYLDLAFIRLYTLSPIWTSLVSGILLIIFGSETADVLGVFLSFLGLGLLIATVYGRWYKEGHYPKIRVVLLGFTGLWVFLAALSFRVFMNPPRDTYWLIYFVIAVLLLFPPWIYLLRSHRSN